MRQKTNTMTNECTKVQNPRRIQITFVITYVCRVIKFAKLYNVAIIAKIVKSWGIYYYRLSCVYDYFAIVLCAYSRARARTLIEHMRM